MLVVSLVLPPTERPLKSNPAFIETSIVWVVEVESVVVVLDEIP